MSILDETGQTESITAGWRALELFTDRFEATRTFAEYLNEDPPRKQILFFYGDGGNGKSLLLSHLRQHCCKRLSSENWRYVKTFQDEEFAMHIRQAEGAEPVPSALLDFAWQPRGEDRPQEAFRALLMLRRALSGPGFRYPLFDFACIWYLYKTDQLSKERLRSLFPAREMDLIIEIVDVVTDSSWGAVGKAVLGIFDKHLSERFTLYLQRRKLEPSQVEALQRMDPQSELMDQLPRLFADDLNATMADEGAPERVVLFFDTHEAFWGQQRDLAAHAFFQRDEWLRLLVGTLDLSAGIVVVIAGRDRPRWSEATRIVIPNAYVDERLVGHLSEADAGRYLERAGIPDRAMRACLVAWAQVAPDQVHPHYLGLCADVVLAASRQGLTLTPEDFRGAPQVADKGRQLMDRLLSYVGADVRNAVHALSACRAFNREIYSELGDKLDFQATRAGFAILTQFSFVWRAERRGEDWYRIHDLVRRLLDEAGNTMTREAHQVMERYYRQRAELAEGVARVEAIYHLNRLDWELGVDEWAELFDEALELSRYGLCRALLEVRSELSIETDFSLGRVSRREGEYFASLARYDETKQEYIEAIAAFDAARLAPDLVMAHSNKGLALFRLGEVQAALAEHGPAKASLDAAIGALDAVLRLAPDDVQIQSNRGSALASRGELQVALAEHEEAIESLTGAIAAYDGVLNRAPGHAIVHANRGTVFASLGRVRVALQQHEQAVTSFTAAVADYDAALQLAPEYVNAHYNKGTALTRLGEAQAVLKRHERAMACIRAALAEFGRVLELAPGDKGAEAWREYVQKLMDGPAGTEGS